MLAFLKSRCPCSRRGQIAAAAGCPHLAGVLEGGVVEAEGAQGAGLAVGPGQAEQHQLEPVQRALQPLVQLYGAPLPAGEHPVGRAPQAGQRPQVHCAQQRSCGFMTTPWKTTPGDTDHRSYFFMEHLLSASSWDGHRPKEVPGAGSLPVGREHATCTPVYRAAARQKGMRPQSD